jgi:hypothetical protein
VGDSPKHDLALGCLIWKGPFIKKEEQSPPLFI